MLQVSIIVLPDFMDESLVCVPTGNVETMRSGYVFPECRIVGIPKQIQSFFDPAMPPEEYLGHCIQLGAIEPVSEDSSPGMFKFFDFRESSPIKCSYRRVDKFALGKLVSDKNMVWDQTFLDELKSRSI